MNDNPADCPLCGEYIRKGIGHKLGCDMESKMRNLSTQEQEAIMEATRALYRLRKATGGDVLFEQDTRAIFELVVAQHMNFTEEEFMLEMERTNPNKARA